jgi:hypothetical protein
LNTSSFVCSLGQHRRLLNHGLLVVNVLENMLKNTEKNLTVEFVYGQDWQETVYLTDCCEVGVVLCKNTGESLKHVKH